MKQHLLVTTSADSSVYPVAAVRQSKTSQQNIKVVGARPLSSDQI